MIDRYQRDQCRIQGQLFELGAEQNYESTSFVKCFMNSDEARRLDMPYSHLQWAGKEYILESLEDDYQDRLKKGGTIFDKESLYWIGYVYRYWNLYTGESSRDIYKLAPLKRMLSVYEAYHSMDVEMAIDRLKE